MSKKLLIPISLFLVLTGILLAVFVTNTTIVAPSAHPAESEGRSEVSSPQITLSFTPSSLTVSPGKSTTLAILLVSSRPTDTITLAQFEIGFDPTAITDIQIQPGDFFANPTVLLNNINPKNGRISYALEASQQTKKQQGIVATITFTPNPSYWQKQTSFSLLPKTMIRDKTNNNLSLTTTGATIIF